ncbi:MAG: mechanosensitive ion channel family protein [Nanoarchaeota archaeon]
MILDFIPFADFELLGIPFSRWVTALVIFVFIFSALKIFRKVVLVKLRKLAKKTKTELDEMAIDAIQSLSNFFYFFVSIYFPLKYLNLSDTFNMVVDNAIIIVISFYVVRGLAVGVDYGVKDISKKKESGTSIVRFMGLFIKILLWLVALIFILSNMGIEVTSLLAGLGVGGLAVALALQNVFDDLFSAFSIYLDKPFEHGDFIVVGEHLGVVKNIGLKTTRLESLWGQEIVISNKELTSTRIDNYKKMSKRRIHFKIGVTYQTPNKKLVLINKIIKDIFEKIELADLDRTHFKEFGDSALVYEVAYYVDSADYAEYMNIQQEVNLKLKEKFEKEGIEFAYPTRTVFLQK